MPPRLPTTSASLLPAKLLLPQKLKKERKNNSMQLLIQTRRVEEEAAHVGLVSSYSESSQRLWRPEQEESFYYLNYIMEYWTYILSHWHTWSPWHKHIYMFYYYYDWLGPGEGKRATIWELELVVWGMGRWGRRRLIWLLGQARCLGSCGRISSLVTYVFFHSFLFFTCKMTRRTRKMKCIYRSYDATFASLFMEQWFL